MDVPVVRDLTDSSKRRKIGRIITAKYSERRRGDDFDSGPLMDGGNSPCPAAGIA